MFDILSLLKITPEIRKKIEDVIDVLFMLGINNVSIEIGKYALTFQREGSKLKLIAEKSVTNSKGE